ncbi:AN1-type zinc finger protein 1 [Balamuthia mandrillaris]
MEFPSLGKQCSKRDCKQLDFLPFTCDACHRIFCLEHHKYKDHQCELHETRDKVLPSCPLCGALVRVAPGEDVNAKMDEHIQAGCPTTETTKPEKSNPCSVKTCKGGELVPVICPYCRKNFCLRHRAPSDHRCKNDPSNSPESSASVSPARAEELQKHKQRQASVLSRIEGFLKNHRNKKQSAKVQLMRMKSTAKGDERIPAENRYYLEVLFPMDSKVQPKMMFFNKNHVVGKVLDIIADAGRIENLNNKMGAEKLYLISVNTGEPMPNATKLCDLPPDVLQSGGCVLLEKLSNL